MTEQTTDGESARLFLDEFERVIGAKVRLLREERGWSQSDLARRLSDIGLEMHQTTVAKMEAGRRPLRVSEAVAVAQACGLPGNALFWLPVPGETPTLAQAREDLARTEQAAEETERVLMGSIEMYTKMYASQLAHVRQMADLADTLAKVQAATETERDQVTADAMATIDRMQEQSKRPSDA